MKLETVLNDLISGRLSSGKLSGGLALQFKPADHDNGENRLAAIRDQVHPSQTEIDVLLKALHQVLPGRAILVDEKDQQVPGNDGQPRFYRVFRWTNDTAVQSKMPFWETTETKKAKHNYEN